MKIKSVEILEGDFEIICIPPGTSVEVEGITLTNETKTGFPDIDSDFSSCDEVKEKLIDLWGENSVCYISNWNTLQIKSLLKDLAKFYDIPFPEVNAVTGKMIYEATPKAKEKNGIKAGAYNPTFEEVMEFSDTLKKFLEKYPHIKTHVTNLTRQIRSCGQHAGGILVGQDLNKHIPLIRSKGKTQSPWCEGQNVRHLEPLGFVKFDILGLGTLRMFESCIELILKNQGNENPTFEDIKEWYNQNLHPDKINFDDQNVYENVFQNGNFIGVFQFAEKGMQRFCKRAQPTSLVDISNISAIYRPGPLASKVDEAYVQAKQNPENVQYEHPLLQEVLGKNYGLIIYQEDLAWLAHKLGKNVSLEEGNLLRKVLIKRGTGKGHEVKDKIKEKFVEGCVERGVESGKARKLWEEMEHHSQYSFNKCLHYSSVVQTQTSKKQIKDVKRGEFVNSVNGFVKVKNVFKNGKKPVFKIKTESGKELICTLEHKLQTRYGMKTLKEILEKKLSVIVNDDFCAREEKIIEVIPFGEEETFDLEVDHPEHSFYANDISVSNSHALSYSIISFQCAYLLTYHSSEWICAFLNETKEETKAMNLLQSHGYTITDVNVNKSSLKWMPGKTDKEIIRPLTSIKGFGEKAMEQVIKHRPFEQIEDLLFHPEVNYQKLSKRAIDALVRSGACNDLMDTNRFFNFKHFWLSVASDRPKKLIDLWKNIEKYKDEEDFTIEEKINNAVKLTGVFPLSLVVDSKVNARLASKDVPPISEYDQEKKLCWFVARRLETKKTVNNRPYWELFVTDGIVAQDIKIKCWNVGNSNKNSFKLNRPYIGKIEFDEKYGFSVTVPLDNFRMVG